MEELTELDLKLVGKDVLWNIQYNWLANEEFVELDDSRYWTREEVREAGIKIVRLWFAQLYDKIELRDEGV